MDSDKKRLQRLIIYTKIEKMIDLKEILEMPYHDSRLSLIMKGTRKITRKMALKIHEKWPDVNYEYLCTGEGNFLAQRPTDPIHVKIKKMEAQMEQVRYKIDFVYNLKK